MKMIAAMGRLPARSVGEVLWRLALLGVLAWNALEVGRAADAASAPSARDVLAADALDKLTEQVQGLKVAAQRAALGPDLSEIDEHLRAIASSLSVISLSQASR